jgi:Protein of unknown function (DUF2442)
MNSLANKKIEVTAISARVTDDTLIVDLSDGRTISAPLAWYPRLLHGTTAERSKHEFIGGGEGIHWPELDEDISVEGVLAGRPSGESNKSFGEWLASRAQQSAAVR